MAKKILLVDDEKDICQLVKDLFEEEGHKVLTALSGDEALVLLRKQRVDLVLIDYFMPVMDGRELLEKIRADSTLKDLRCAFLTVASASEILNGGAKKLQILEVISKPFSNELLKSKVKKLLQ
jgi:CheY-like chemotaxis protein